MFATKFSKSLLSQKQLIRTPIFAFNSMEDSEYQHLPKKSYIKPFTITGDNTVLTLTCLKGRFKQQQNYITLDKMGTILIEFIPLKKSDSSSYPTFNPKGKKSFSLNLKSVGEVLKYNPYDLNKKEIQLKFGYFAASIDEQKTLKIEKKPEEEKVTFLLETQRGKDNVNLSVDVSEGEFLVMQELLKYSLSYMMGWHILNSPFLGEEEASFAALNEMDRADI